MLNSFDLYYLENNITLLESNFKQALVNVLNTLDKNNVLEDIEVTDTGGNYKTIKALCDDVLNSQQIIDEGNTVYRNSIGELTENTTETPLTVVGATANNLSAGTRAWVDGHYIEGNGADCAYYYNLGYTDGKSDTPNATVEYVYHVHEGGTSSVIYSKTTVGGCYKANGHTHNKTGTCSTKTVIEDCPGHVTFTTADMKAQFGNGTWYGYKPCPVCGTSIQSTKKEASTWGEPCTANPTEVTTYTCGNPVNTYKRSCGKTTKTIEKAIIVFN